MSSKPSPAGVADLLKAAQDMRQAENRIDRLRAQIAELQAHLKVQEAARDAAASAITKQLTAMDCEYSGNFGWEGRIRYMLAELVEQAERYARAHP